MQVDNSHDSWDNILGALAAIGLAAYTLKEKFFTFKIKTSQQKLLEIKDDIIKATMVEVELLREDMSTLRQDLRDSRAESRSDKAMIMDLMSKIMDKINKGDML